MATYTKDSHVYISGNIQVFDGDRFEGLTYDSVKIGGHLKNCCFVDCDFSELIWTGILKNVVFENCRFYCCDIYLSMFNVSFPGTSISRTNFYGGEMRGLDFRGVVIKCVSFAGSSNVFPPFYPPIEVEDIPELPQIVAREIIGNPSGLNMEFWHSDCGTAHCLAGWTVVKHPQGKELEELFGTPLAAKILFPRAELYFYKPKTEVMEFLKAIAQ